MLLFVLLSYTFHTTSPLHNNNSTPNKTDKKMEQLDNVRGLLPKTTFVRKHLYSNKAVLTADVVDDVCVWKEIRLVYGVRCSASEI